MVLKGFKFTVGALLALNIAYAIARSLDIVLELVEESRDGSGESESSGDSGEGTEGAVLRLPDNFERLHGTD